jgi:hypothetical protein
MSDPEHLESAIAHFRTLPETEWWPQAEALDALIREAARLLFALCRADQRAWLSEGDLQGMLYAIFQRELPAHGLPASAVHASYPFQLTQKPTVQLGQKRPPRERRTRPVDLVLVVPQTIHTVRGRRWAGEMVAAIELKRGYKRHREIREDLQKLAAIHESWPQIQPYMLIMGYRNSQEDIAAVNRMALQAGVTLLGDNYWAQPGQVAQLELG